MYIGTCPNSGQAYMCIPVYTQVLRNIIPSTQSHLSTVLFYWYFTYRESMFCCTQWDFHSSSPTAEKQPGPLNVDLLKRRKATGRRHGGMNLPAQPALEGDRYLHGLHRSRACSWFPACPCIGVCFPSSVCLTGSLPVCLTSSCPRCKPTVAGACCEGTPVCFSVCLSPIIWHRCEPYLRP